MSLRVQAEGDLAVTLEAPGDFGFPFVITDPAGLSSPADGDPAQLHGQSGDIGTVIDPDTGMAITGRLAHLSVRISSLVAAGFTTLPSSAPDSALEPWIARYKDLAGNVQPFKVKSSMPDRTLGMVTLVLEFWKDAP